MFIYIYIYNNEYAIPAGIQEGSYAPNKETQPSKCTNRASDNKNKQTIRTPHATRVHTQTCNQANKSTTDTTTKQTQNKPAQERDRRHKGSRPSPRHSNAHNKTKTSDNQHATGRGIVPPHIQCRPHKHIQAHTHTHTGGGILPSVCIASAPGWLISPSTFTVKMAIMPLMWRGVDYLL